MVSPLSRHFDRAISWIYTRRRIRHDRLVTSDWRWKLAAGLERLAKELKAHEPPLGQQGVRLRSVYSHMSSGYPVYTISSLRGNLSMGILEWSNQWRRPRFQADPSAVFDQQCIAEIFAMMKEFK